MDVMFRRGPAVGADLDELGLVTQNWGGQILGRLWGWCRGILYGTLKNKRNLVLKPGEFPHIKCSVIFVYQLFHPKRYGCENSCNPSFYRAQWMGELIIGKNVSLVSKVQKIIQNITFTRISFC